MTRTPGLTYSVIAQIQGANSRHMVGALRELGATNLRSKRARMAREGMARVAAANRRPAPGTIGEPLRQSDVPVTFKAERPQRRRVTRAATSTAPAERVHTPIKAAELDKQMKATAKRILDADGPDGWRLFAVMNREDGRVNVYVRKQGASVRYSTAR
ncbi:hypothetical protein [Streptomyces sp. NBC_01579]|uniref:hypothetical protein n=1 Tax=Streptomyces sp. NBC_01579 TaxID=2975885 RepID=UPI003868ACCB